MQAKAGAAAARRIVTRRSASAVDERDLEFMRSLRDILEERDRRRILREATLILNRSIQPESIVILRISRPGDPPRVVASAGSVSFLRRFMATSGFGRMLVAALRRRRPLMLADFLEPRPRSTIRGEGRRPVIRGIIVRIDGAEGPFGALAMRARRDSRFGESEARLARTVADLVSLTITRFESERRLRETTRRFRRLVDSSADVIYLTSIAPELRVDYISPSIETLTGYSPRDFYADPGLIFSIVHPEDVSTLRMDLAQPTRLKGRHSIRLVHRNGRRTWVSVSRLPIHDRRGRVVAVQGTLGEVSEEVAEREQLRAAAESTRALLEGRQLETALRAILQHVRHVFDADEVIIAAGARDKSALRIVSNDGDGRAGRGQRSALLRDPLIRRALRAGRPVVQTGNLATVIPWATDRVGLLIVRGVPGVEVNAGESVAPLDRFAREIAALTDSVRSLEELRARAIDQDRSRIARELHDGVVQTLFAVALQLQLEPDAAPEPARSRITLAVAGIREAIQDIQQYVFDLEPSLLTLRGLASSLQQLAVEFETNSGVPIRLEAEPDAVATLEVVGTHVLQIVREALSNVRRHAQAHSVILRVRHRPRATVLEIQDDGVGFDAEAAQGLGLRNLRTRARLLGGKLELHSRPGRGSLMRLTVPVSGREPEQNSDSAPA